MKSCIIFSPEITVCRNDNLILIIDHRHALPGRLTVNRNFCIRSSCYVICRIIWNCIINMTIFILRPQPEAELVFCVCIRFYIYHTVYLAFCIYRKWDSVFFTIIQIITGLCNAGAVTDLNTDSLPFCSHGMVRFPTDTAFRFFIIKNQGLSMLVLWNFRRKVFKTPDKAPCAIQLRLFSIFHHHTTTSWLISILRKCYRIHNFCTFQCNRILIIITEFCIVTIIRCNHIILHALLSFILLCNAKLYRTFSGFVIQLYANRIHAALFLTAVIPHVIHRIVIQRSCEFFLFWYLQDCRSRTA